MTTFRRWLTFNLVGAGGMLVQMGALALLNRASHGHYLLATAAAIECALLHNFFWHMRYTWRERTNSVSYPRWFLRFQLSNGVVSLVGNLALMRLLVKDAGIPIPLANGMAIACCSIMNFVFSDRWTFLPRTEMGRNAIFRRHSISCEEARQGHPRRGLPAEYRSW